MVSFMVVVVVSILESNDVTTNGGGVGVVVLTTGSSTRTRSGSAGSDKFSSGISIMVWSSSSSWCFGCGVGCRSLSVSLFS